MGKLLLVLLSSIALLSGCVVVPVAPRGAYYDPAPVYVDPGPVWVRPYYRHRYLRRHYRWD